ncbi:MarP family serine protease [Jatrophihabitans fulvus]
MNLLDLLIVLAAIGYGIGGFRSGAVVGAFSLVGFFGGAAIGAQLARPLGSALADGTAQIPIAIVSVLLCAMLGQLLAVFLAGMIKDRFVRGAVRPWDSALGAVLGVVAVLLVAWMVALPLATSAYPTLAQQASQSKIVRGVNQVVPDAVRGLYSSLRDFFNRSGFPPVLGDLPSTSVVPVAPPPRTLPQSARRVVVNSERSIVKIYGQAPECGRGIEGSGFVFAPNRVMTNAHVVAGTRTVRVVVGRNDANTTPARVVYFDPDRDVAVLAVPGLSAPALPFAQVPAPRGTPAMVVGYPEDRSYTTNTARVRSRTTVRGSDIYGNGTVTREIYSVRATVRSGNSGGPLLDYQGRVLGVVFATALDSRDTGFVLTRDEVRSAAQTGRTATAAVGTGGCTPG